jgi:3-phosphoshikimate 1-carboxyvinyltransferase
MQYTINPPKTIDTTIKLPASKSISNRVLIINALAGGNIIPQNISECDDTDVTLAALKNMPEVIDIKAAGTEMRFLTAYLAATPGKHIITGTERMKRRPIGLLVDALRMLGADIEYVGEEGFPPLKIK